MNLEGGQFASGEEGNVVARQISLSIFFTVFISVLPFLGAPSWDTTRQSMNPTKSV